MAEKEDENKNQNDKTEKDEKAQSVGTKISILTWIIMATAVVIFAGSGFILGRLFAGSSAPKTAEPAKETAQTKEAVKADSTADNGDTWYYNDLESIVVNPDEPGATRFVRVGLILEISSDLSEEKAKELINGKKPPLVNWVNIYFKGLTLDQMRNDQDMKRIQSQILDGFNEILFPGAKPQIKRVLIREFNIQ
jgi:flagellar basal body-associated protein FliL